MGLFTAPSTSPYGIQAPIQQINEYPLWGTEVALALYFTEVAGMLMAILGIMEFTGKYPSMAKKGAPTVFVATILAFAFFAYDLGRPFAATSSPIEALANFSHSWMARGIIFVSGLLLFSLLYTISVFVKKVPTFARITFSTLGMLFGIFATTYSGFEFAATTGIPFWNNAGIPVLFLAGGAFVGAGIGYILAFVTKGDEGIMARRLMAKLLAYSGIAELVSWFLFLATVNFINVFDEVAYDYLISQSTFYADLTLSALSVLISGIGSLVSSNVTRMLFKQQVQAPKQAIGEIKPSDLPTAIKYAILIAAVFAIVAAYLTRADILFAGQFAYQTAPQTPFQIVSNQPIPIGSFGWRG